MTLVIVAVAAVACIVLRFAQPRWAQANSMGTLALMYAGASLMWSVDMVFCLMEGEAFIDLSNAAATADDAFLGVLVVMCGLAVWGVLNAVKNTRGAKTTAA